jgi:proteasome accessory factor C
VADPAWLRSLLLRLGRSVRAVLPAEAASGARDAAVEALAAYGAE